MTLNLDGLTPLDISWESHKQAHYFFVYSEDLLTSSTMLSEITFCSKIKAPTLPKWRQS